MRIFFQNYDIRDKLKNISCPTLILQGDYDPMPLEGAQQIHENISGSKLKVIKNAGHWLWVEAADQVIPKIRDFLRNQ